MQAFEDTGRKVEESMSRQFQVSAYWSAPEDQKLMEIVKASFQLLVYVFSGPYDLNMPLPRCSLRELRTGLARQRC